MNPSRRAFLAWMVTVPAAVKLAPFVAPAPAVVSSTRGWKNFAAGERIEAGQLVALGADGRAYAAAGIFYSYSALAAEMDSDPMVTYAVRERGRHLAIAIRSLGRADR